MAVAEISIVPVGTDAPSYSSFVDAALRACAAGGLRHQVGAMSTVVEGESAEILHLARQMHRAVLDAGAERVVTHIALEERLDRGDGIDRRLEAAAPAAQ